MNRVLALHAGSRGFDSHREHMSERFFRSSRPGYPHPVSSELENSGIRMAVGDCSFRLIKPAKLCMCTQNTTNTTRTDARRRVCSAMVPLRELEYTHTVIQVSHTLTVSTVEILSFRADKSLQTVKTKIRLLLRNRSDQGLHNCRFSCAVLKASAYSRTEITGNK